MILVEFWHCVYHEVVKCISTQKIRETIDNELNVISIYVVKGIGVTVLLE
jgi:hypothetical protein